VTWCAGDRCRDRCAPVATAVAHSQLDPCRSAAVQPAGALAHCARSARCMAYGGRRVFDAASTPRSSFSAAAAAAAASAAKQCQFSQPGRRWCLTFIGIAVATQLTGPKPFMTLWLLVSETAPPAPLAYTQGINAGVRFIAVSRIGFVAPLPAVSVLWPTFRYSMDVRSNKGTYSEHGALIPPSAFSVRLLNYQRLNSCNKQEGGRLHGSHCGLIRAGHWLLEWMLPPAMRLW